MVGTLPVGTILTIAAAGSEGSPDSVITREDGMFKRGASGDAIRPRFSILNPALTQTLPSYQTAAGITDIMAHLYERYLTNTPEVEVTDRLIEVLRSFLISIGMPKNFAELGAREEDIPELVRVLCRGDGRGGSISGFVTLNEEDCEKIYRMMV